jgi:lipoprotein-releasing system permease protein
VLREICVCAWPATFGRYGCARVKAPFSLFLALRYLKPKRTFVSVITVISVLGVTLGITVLILVISVMTGFDQELRRKVLGFDAHLLITSDGVMRDWRDVRDEIDKQPHVIATAPFVQGPVIAEFEGRRMAPKIRGIDVESETKVTDIHSVIVDGTLDLDGDKVVLGQELAKQLGVGVGDKVTIFSPGNISEIMAELEKAEKEPGKEKSMQELREMVLPADLLVTGIFKSGRYIYDTEFLLVPLHVGQELYGLGDDLHGITVKTDDPYMAPRVKEALLDVLPLPLQVDTWIDLNKQLFDAIAMERNVMFFLLLFIVIVAAFGIMNTLITVTVQKTREIGIMKALGATTSQIVWIFLSQGMIVGFFGNITGLGLGMALVRWRNEAKDFLAKALGVEVFPAGVYQFSAIPAEVVPQDVAVICISAFVICSLAALIPAYTAARLDPVKALRYE